MNGDGINEPASLDMARARMSDWVTFNGDVDLDQVGLLKVGNPKGTTSH